MTASPAVTYEVHSVIDPDMGEGWAVLSIADNRPPRQVAFYGSGRSFAVDAAHRWNVYVKSGEPTKVVAVIDPQTRRPEWGVLVSDDGENLTVRFKQFVGSERVERDVIVPVENAVIWLPPSATDEIAIHYDRKDAAVKAERKFHAAMGETGALWPVTYID